MKYIIFILAILSFFGCDNPIGDKKSVLDSIDEIGNTSFVNKNFKGNLINYDKNLNPCQMLGQEVLASLYKVSSEKIQVIEGIANNQTCTYRVLLGKGEFNFLTGALVIRPDTPDNGTGTWEEQWSIQKATSKSSEYLSGMGKAALWKGNNRTLKIKFDGYTLEVNTPGSAINEEEKKKNRNYKSIAIEMVKAAGFIK